MNHPLGPDDDDLLRKIVEYIDKNSQNQNHR